MPSEEDVRREREERAPASPAVASRHIIVYGAPWCPDCKRSRKFLSEHRVPFRWVDIDQDPAALSYVERAQNGGRTIPMISYRVAGDCSSPAMTSWPARSACGWRRGSTSTTW